jgi:pilus assembly protein Flp/PilA
MGTQPKNKGSLAMNAMNKMLFMLSFKLRDLVEKQEGQDLVEYAMITALIAFGVVSGMGKLSKGLNTAFSNISSTLGTYTN